MNQYTYAVPFTAEQLTNDYAVLGLSQTEIAAKYNTTQKVVWRAMQKMGVAARKPAKRHQTGSANSSWKGGRVLCAKTKRQRGERAKFGNGYFYLLLPDHPNSNKSGYVAEHIAVWTEHAGRAIKEGEMIHHVNLNKHDNRIENLAVTTATQHALWHNQLEELAVEILLQTGLITFDQLGGYRRNEFENQQPSSGPPATFPPSAKETIAGIS